MALSNLWVSHKVWVCVRVCRFRIFRLCECFVPWGCRAGDAGQNDFSWVSYNQMQSDTCQWDLHISAYIKTINGVVLSEVMEPAWVRSKSRCWAAVSAHRPTNQALLLRLMDTFLKILFFHWVFSLWWRTRCFFFFFFTTASTCYTCNLLEAATRRCV